MRFRRRIAVLYEGRIVGYADANAPREAIGLLMGGKAAAPGGSAPFHVELKLGERIRMSISARPWRILDELIEQPSWGGRYIIDLKGLADDPAWKQRRWASLMNWQARQFLSIPRQAVCIN